MNLISEDLGFKNGSLRVKIESWNELQVFFEDCKWKTVDGINGRIHFWRQPYGGWAPLDTNHTGPGQDHAALHYLIRRTASTYSHSHVPEITRNQVIDAIVKGLNKFMSADSQLVRKELVEAERKRRVSLVSDAMEACRKAEEALGIAKMTFRTAKKELDDFRSSFGLADPDVDIAG